MLDGSELAFRCWEGKKMQPWKPPPVGQRVQLSAAAAF
jgi:hypothetical protein